MNYKVLLLSNVSPFSFACVCVCMCVYVCVCVCVCVCVFTFIHREGFICLDQLECQGTDQRCYAFLCQVSIATLE